MAPSAAAFDVDTYLNPYIPRSRLHLLPKSVSRFFGYRSQNATHPRQAHVTLVWAWCFVGAFCGVALIEGVYLNLPRLSGHQVPIVIASFGAAAILEYNTIESPLAQPRNLVFGHFISALIGVCITRLFRLLPEQRFEDLRWLAGAISVGVASSTMSITKTVHPPAGATALLAATSIEITDLGWWLLPLVLLGSMLMLVSALIINNINRRFPMYWWTPVDLAALHDSKHPKKDVETANDVLSEADRPPKRLSDTDTENEGDAKIEEAQTKPHQSRGDELRMSFSGEHEIIITRDRIVVPDWFQINDWETNVLQIFQERLASRTRQ